MNWKPDPRGPRQHTALTVPVPTTRIHVGGVRPQRPLIVGHQQAPLGPRGVAYREAISEGTIHLKASKMGQSP